jgi:hypothetical protein
MAGKRVNLSELATTPPSAAGVPVLGDGDRTGGRMRTVPVASVAPNPINPRENTEDLSDLESMKTIGQLQHRPSGVRSSGGGPGAGTARGAVRKWRGGR